MRFAALALAVMTGLAAASSARAAEDEAPAGSAPAADAQPAAAAPAPAPAEGQPPSVTRPPKQFPKLRQASLLHKYQLGIAMMPGAGFRGIFPYAGAMDEMINCGQQG